MLKFSHYKALWHLTLTCDIYFTDVTSAFPFQSLCHWQLPELAPFISWKTCSLVFLNCAHIFGEHTAILLEEKKNLGWVEWPGWYRFWKEICRKSTEGVCFFADSNKIFPQDVPGENVIYAICKGVARCLCLGHLIEEDSDKRGNFIEKAPNLPITWE